MTLTEMLEAGFDVSLRLIGDKSTYYVYLSHWSFGEDFCYV